MPLPCPLLLLLCGYLCQSPAAARRFELLTDQAIINGSMMTVAPPVTVTQCAALCSRLSGCGGFNRSPTAGCVALLRDSLRFSYRREEPGTVSGTVPAFSCHQRLLLNREAPSGVQRPFGWPVPVYCDQKLDGGGWTLLVTAATAGWTDVQVMVRNEEEPSLSADYSALRRANRLLNHARGGDIFYRLEAQAQTGRRQWGGIFTTPQLESLILQGSGPGWSLVEQFGTWNFNDRSIGNEVAYIDQESSLSGMLLRTSNRDEFGTIVSAVGAPHEGQFLHSPWIEGEMPDSGTVLYWVREN
ncbi:hypothetical protein FJT64_018636 [Amphibalanus amphitrite]|uniref:Fibrinogen C-terminal domain-containing protein n=1 Tax=Amphibalanus amphitrite TaxID=1232801 RepID=A0A6A4X7G3_AMPAM|nr:hypothetical protein FJT64_018636 [Amphibalanus amphitrite]